MELDIRQKRIIVAVEAARQQILQVSHQIHAHPEPGHQEWFASQLLGETLEKYGFEVECNFVGLSTAFCARKRGGKGTPRVAFLAEYDALPGIGHGCGHNFIAASALAAGIGLGAVIAEFDGEVLVVGTPAEETDGAKVAMAAAGAFNDVDAALMVHPHSGNYYVTESLAMDAIEIEFFGKPSHAAAAPWEGLNALDAVLLTFNNVNALRQQVRPEARIHGVITQGGAAPNIIPEYTAARFYLRAKQRVYLDQLLERFKACAQAAALATGTRLEMRNYEASFDNMVNNLVLAERLRDYLMALGSGEFQRAPESYGSVDMGNVSQVVPSAHVLVDITNGQPITLHTLEFQQAACSTYADETLLRAGKALALTGLDVIARPEVREAARREFQASLGYPPAQS